jgi:hypothetical protein
MLYTSHFKNTLPLDRHADYWQRRKSKIGYPKGKNKEANSN